MEELLQKFEQIKINEDLDDIDILKEKLKKCNSRIRDCNKLYNQYLELVEQWKSEKTKSTENQKFLDAYAKMNSELEDKMTVLNNTQSSLKSEIQKKNDIIGKMKLNYGNLQQRYKKLNTACSRLCKCP